LFSSDMALSFVGMDGCAAAWGPEALFKSGR
jgi:hypothetical protein